jgi:hypothetical protein
MRRKRNERTTRMNLQSFIATKRLDSAGRVWTRLALASRLRHEAIRHGRVNEANTLSNLKLRAAALALRLAPELVSIETATDNPRLWSICFKGRGRFHLPAEFMDLASWKPEGRS